MMNRSEIRQKANSEMERRKLRAENEAAARQREIYAKIPEIEEIRRMLAQTATELSRLIIGRKGNYKENFERLRKNNLDGAHMIAELLKAGGYPEDYLEVHYRCKVCNDTGFTDRGMCDCMRRLISRIASEDLNRSANLPDADFAHFSLDYYRGIVIDGIDCYSLMSKNLNFCTEYARLFSEGSDSLLMLGKTGIGKTHLSMSIAKEVINKGYNVIYGSVINILRSIEKEHFGRSEEGSDTFESICACDLLIFDDLGSEHHTPFYESTLYNIINTRINTGKPMIISTNLSKEELASTYNERIISRIFCCCTLLPFAGRDVRQLKRING
ncbi:MAG: ATP-binding protein [Huintestinicola sp.]